MAEFNRPNHVSGKNPDATDTRDAVLENPKATLDTQKEDRRNCPRFPLRLAVSYRTAGSHPTESASMGETLNISSAGLLFAAPDTFALGQRVQVFVEWPARLHGRIPLLLVLDGRILRSGEGQAAMLVRRHEFRTRPAALIH